MNIHRKLIVLVTLLIVWLAMSDQLLAMNHSVVGVTIEKQKIQKIKNKIKRLKRTLTLNNVTEGAIGMGCVMDLFIRFAAWYCNEPEREHSRYYGFGVTTFLFAASFLAWDTRTNLEADIQDLEEELAALGVSVAKT